MVETGNSVVECGVISRVAEGAITFATGAWHAPVIQGTAANQVKAATDSATTVVGFVRKPMTADSIADEDTVDIVTDGSIIQQYISETVAANDLVEVHSTVTQLNKITIDTTSAASSLASLQARAAKVVAPRSGAGLTWVNIGGY